MCWAQFVCLIFCSFDALQFFFLVRFLSPVFLFVYSYGLVLFLITVNSECSRTDICSIWFHGKIHFYVLLNFWKIKNDASALQLILFHPSDAIHTKSSNIVTISLARNIDSFLVKNWDFYSPQMRFLRYADILYMLTLYCEFSTASIQLHASNFI